VVISRSIASTTARARSDATLILKSASYNEYWASLAASHYWRVRMAKGLECCAVPSARARDCLIIGAVDSVSEFLEDLQMRETHPRIRAQ
jgi:hypothetical protein